MRRVEGITLDNLDDLGGRCRSCAFWESTPAEGVDGWTARELKESWVSETLLGWGSCGQILYVDGLPVGHVLYAPPAYVPRAMSFPTAPISTDAVLLMTAHIDPEYTGNGLGRILLQGVARDLTTRGVRAVEAFGRTLPWGPGAGSGCLLPADFLRAVGFKTVRPHPVTPRLRMDIRSLVTWREDVESAIERLLGSISSPVTAIGGR